MPWKNQFTMENEHGEITAYSGEGISWYPNGDSTSLDAHFTMSGDVNTFHVSVPRGPNGGYNSHIYFVISGTDGPQRVRNLDEPNVPERFKIGLVNAGQYLGLAQRFWVSAWEPDEE